jgi:CO/xanthine dehydrogenase Mo-binding subunit
MGGDYDNILSRRICRLEGRMIRIEVIVQEIATRLGIDIAELEARMPPQQRAIQQSFMAGDMGTTAELYQKMYGLRKLNEAVEALEIGRF